MSTVSPAEARDRKHPARVTPGHPAKCHCGECLYRQRPRAGSRPLGPGHCAAFKLAWKYEKECRREYRQDPTTATLGGYIEAQRNTEFVLYSYERA